METNNKGEQCATCLPLTLPSYILQHPVLRPEADFHGLSAPPLLTGFQLLFGQ